MKNFFAILTTLLICSPLFFGSGTVLAAQKTKLEEIDGWNKVKFGMNKEQVMNIIDGKNVDWPCSSRVLNLHGVGYLCDFVSPKSPIRAGGIEWPDHNSYFLFGVNDKTLRKIIFTAAEQFTTEQNFHQLHEVLTKKYGNAMITENNEPNPEVFCNKQKEKWNSGESMKPPDFSYFEIYHSFKIKQKVGSIIGVYNKFVFCQNLPDELTSRFFKPGQITTNLKVTYEKNDVLTSDGL